MGLFSVRSQPSQEAKSSLDLSEVRLLHPGHCRGGRGWKGGGIFSCQRSALYGELLLDG